MGIRSYSCKFKKLRRCLISGSLATLFLHAGSVYSDGDWHAELSALSDYYYRGYSKTRSNPVMQAHIDYEDDIGWFTGFWISQVSFDDRPDPNHSDFEVKPYLGWTLPVAPDLKAQVSAMGYIYNDKLFTQDANYVEFYASLHYQDWLSGLISVAPDAYQRDATVFNYELNYRRDIFDNVQFSAGLGFNQARELLKRDYFYWNAGISWFLTRHLSLDARYVDVSLDRPRYSGSEIDEFYPRLQESKYLLSVTFGF